MMNEADLFDPEQPVLQPEVFQRSLILLILVLVFILDKPKLPTGVSIGSTPNTEGRD